MKSTELYTVRIFVEGYPESRYANYRYMLLEDEKEVESLGQRHLVPCFGIEVIREDIKGDLIYAVEKDRIDVMTTYRYKVVQLLRKLYDNCVSPVNLVEIAGPIADEWVSDFDDILSSIAAQ